MYSEKIYGNAHVLEALESMLKNGRMPHSFLIYGENGLGKKLMASYIAEKIVSPEKDINQYAYPDIIRVGHSGKTNGFSVADLKELCADAYILPNSSDKKVYILEDCDNISISAQNTLLKIIEEPPEFTSFIFTVQSKSLLLPTVLSRVVSLGMSECTKEECHDALVHRGYSNENEIQDAILSFGGNIGHCLEYLDGGAMKKAADTARRIADCICEKDEYSLLVLLSSIDSDKQLIKQIFELLVKIIRDASACKIGAEKISCYPIGAEKMSASFSARKLIKLYDTICKCIEEINTNVSISLELSALCGRVFEI